MSSNPSVNLTPVYEFSASGATGFSPQAPTARWPSHWLYDMSAQVSSIDPLPRAQGSFSDVHKGSLTTDISVAIKIFGVCKGEETNIPILEHYRREVRAYELLSPNHPHVAKVHGVATIGGGPAIVIKMYENGNAPQYLHLNPHASAHRYVLNIIEGIKSLHTHLTRLDFTLASV
ncbi:hypothetical protein JAAARDRAFT_204279 [Jaapia argillacea MUCL 33604]|uniref:Protein kinase domain-containing protein n=1 Tax=Jaapia argillacea MUCL 33604 TaxID=933084 RepID=A0A067Q6T5_9AGAM|nr:hypothetical protein JAAARDRAFT_204279 [Jaapia argillacea MUCL 33604]